MFKEADFTRLNKMDDAVTISMILALFTLNYLALGKIWFQLNRYSNSLKILCREHADLHGGKELEV